MAELTISYSLYEICYDDISDMEVYQKKKFKFVKKKFPLEAKPERLKI